MKTKHTPGPWRQDPTGDCGLHYIGNDYHFTAVAAAESLESSEIDANARLIAAAPELLQALEGVEAYLSNACDQGVLDEAPAYREWMNVRAAIAKATEQP